MKMQYLLFLVLSVQAFSAENNKEANHLQETLNSKITNITSNSNFHRQDKNFELKAGLGSFYGDSAYNLTIGKYLNPNTVLQLSYLQYIKSESERKRFKDSSQFGISTGLQFYLGNSFFLNPELAFIQNNYSGLAFDSKTDSEPFMINNNKYRRFTVGLNIGNQWQWKSFTLGVRWIGAHAIVARSNKENRFLSEYGSTTNYHLNILNLNLGASF